MLRIGESIRNNGSGMYNYFQFVEKMHLVWQDQSSAMRLPSCTLVYNPNISHLRSGRHGYLPLRLHQVGSSARIVEGGPPKVPPKGFLSPRVDEIGGSGMNGGKHRG